MKHVKMRVDKKNLLNPNIILLATFVQRFIWTNRLL